ncbi:MAG: hypothetical protein IPK66_17735 [Rhodospirillales bacterium]|nr:hypothetical protein [Rhodospirillales bacterium]
MRMVLMFLCCEWIPLLHWRPGLAYAFAVVIAYLPKAFLLAQLPLNGLYVDFLLLSQMALGAQFLLAAGSTIFGGHDTTDPGSSVLNILRKPKFTWLTLEPIVAVGFALVCAGSTLAGDPPMLLPYIAGQPVMFPGPWAFWEDVGPDGQMLAMLLVPLVSALALRRYNRMLYAQTDLAFAEAAGMSGSRPPKKPTSATIAGSAITFPKVTGVSRKADAPSLKKIGGSFR